MPAAPDIAARLISLNSKPSNAKLVIFMSFHFLPSHNPAQIQQIQQIPKSHLGVANNYEHKYFVSEVVENSTTIDLEGSNIEWEYTNRYNAY
jgi:hypothetical protein